MSEQTVLIVDDEEEFLISLKQGLEPYRETFVVHTANDGKEALSVLEANPVDLVVTDLKMDGMDGFQLMAHLRVHYPAVPIVVITAFASSEVVKRLKRIGVSQVLDKPLDLDGLTAAILGGLSAPNPSGGLAGISTSGFLQLIEMEQKSCCLKAENQSGESGSFLFREGRLVDARLGDVRGEEAAYIMLGWDNPALSFNNGPPPEDGGTITSPLMSILLEGSKRKDEALESVAHEMADLTPPDDGMETDDPDNPSRSNPQPENQQQGRPTMAGLKPILKEMADEMDGVIALAVVGMDGILVAAHNPTGAEVEVMSAKFAMLLKLASRTAEQIKGMGEFEENLVQSQNAWVLSRYLSQNYYLGIAVSRDGTLGNIRLVAQKYTDKLARAL